MFRLIQDTEWRYKRRGEVSCKFCTTIVLSALLQPIC